MKFAIIDSAQLGIDDWTPAKHIPGVRADELRALIARRRKLIARYSKPLDKWKAELRGLEKLNE